MAFLRFSRDKRGYELFSLVQAEQRGGQSRPRVLYAFRTPPNIKVGRNPFDDETRKALEQANPGVGFDWRQIVDTPIPSADAEMWRERRRAMKVAKLALKKDKDKEEQEAQRAAAGPPSAPGESRSARRRRRRRARRDDAQTADVSTEARSPLHEGEGGSEIPKIEETPVEAADEGESAS